MVIILNITLYSICLNLKKRKVKKNKFRKKTDKIKWKSRDNTQKEFVFYCPK